MNFRSLFRSLAYFSIAYFIKKKMKACSYFTMVSYLDKAAFPFPLLALWWGSKSGRMNIHVTTTILQFFSILVLRHSELPCKTTCGQEQRRPKLATIFKNKKFQSCPYLDKVTFSICVFFKFSLLPRTKCSKESIKSLLGFFPSRPYTAC